MTNLKKKKKKKKKIVFILLAPNHDFFLFKSNKYKQEHYSGATEMY
jgi:hypothetical protein